MRTVQIGTLVGWDSDNPTATWGGLLGFMLGVDGVEMAFQHEAADTAISKTYWIHRTRRNFPDHLPQQKGENSFANMAARELATIDLVVVEQMGGEVDQASNSWVIPRPK